MNYQAKAETYCLLLESERWTCRKHPVVNIYFKNTYKTNCGLSLSDDFEAIETKACEVKILQNLSLYGYLNYVNYSKYI